MIHVVTHRNRGLYADALLQMHRLRKLHFVDRRQWRGVRVCDGGEFDRYDDEAAIYLLALEADGQLAASMRLRPVQSGSVLKDSLPHLLYPEKLDLRGREVWEISRYCASPAARGRRSAYRQTEIRLAALEIALAHRVEMMVGVVDLDLLARLMDCSGWRIGLLGEPSPYADGLIQAVTVEVSLEALVEMQESQGLACPVGREGCPSCDRDVAPQDFEILNQVRVLPSKRRRLAVDLMRSFLKAEPDLSFQDLADCVDHASATLRARVGAQDDLNMA